MNSLERVQKTILRESVDHIPVYPFINQFARKRNRIGFSKWSSNMEKCSEAILKTTEELDIDIISTQTNLSAIAADWSGQMGYTLDGHLGETLPFITTSDEYENIKRLNPIETVRMLNQLKLTEKLYLAKGTEKFIMGEILGPLELLSVLRGTGNLFYDIITCPDKVQKALENICNTLADLAVLMVKAGAHAIMINSIFASELFMSSDMWREFEGNYLKKISQEIRKSGGMVFIQSTMERSFFSVIIDEIKPEVLSFLYFPECCSSMKKMKEMYGDKVTIMGHIDPGFLTVCSEEQLRELCRKQIEIYNSDGGFILATGYDYPDSIGDNYAKIMAQEAKDYICV